MRSIGLLKPSFALFWFMAFLFLQSCINKKVDTIQSSPTISQGQRIQYVVKAQGRSLQILGHSLLEAFPPKAYTYLFLGQSPTPLFGVISSPRSCPLQPDSFAIPFSKGGALRGILKQNPALWAQLVLHLDSYLTPMLQQMIQGKAPYRIVVVDYLESGQGLGSFLRILREYLVWKQSSCSDRSFGDFVQTNKGGVLPEIQYFGMTDPKRNINTIKSTISDDHLLPETPYSRQKTTFRGIIVPLSKERFDTLGVAFANSAFDEYSPFGSWALGETSPLSPRQTPLRAVFHDLQKTLEAAGVRCL